MDERPQQSAAGCALARDDTAAPAPTAGAAAVAAPTDTNRLALESSPYLRAHAHNPVDWFPWGPEALERARSSGKPILLSIGYAACHWCHVMAHESFEDRATAAAMNELYINIKVDREERPDIDRLYQLAQHLLTGRSGGWPLTMFLMHEDQRPFFGGTYFPREARFGLPAFREVLRQVAAYYHAHPAELRKSAARLVAALEEIQAPGIADPRATAHPQATTGALPTAGSRLTREPLRLCRAHLERGFDREDGGFGAAPKFPHAPSLVRLLHDWRSSAGADVPDVQALSMASLTLTRMAEGGLFDQLGGGFFRYSIDARWQIPHFEKMLYDNALLLGLYAQSALATGKALFGEVASRTAAFMLEELASPAGALYSSLDADSEGHEGRYYLWRAEEARAALGAEEFALFARRYGLDGPPNFEGQWHLTAHGTIEQLASERGMSAESARALLATARQRLAEQRRQRVRPALDDKVLTSWNALAIAGLATAARCLARPDLAEAAAASLRYLRGMHWRDGRLLAVSAGAGAAARLPAYLDDYAFLVDAICELARVRFRADELAWAVELCEVLLEHFEDRERGGFYFTADDHEALISRSKSFSDEAIPSGNAVAARALLALGALLAEPRYLAAAERSLLAAWPALLAYPEGHASMLLALEDYLDPRRIVVLRGPVDAIEAWRRELDREFSPRRWTLAIAGDAQGLPPALAAKPAAEHPVGFVCRGMQCGAAVDTLDALMSAVDEEEDDDAVSAGRA